jgi:hypothetical protein
MSKPSFAPFSKRPGSSVLKLVDRLLASVLANEVNPVLAFECIRTLEREGIDWPAVFRLIWQNHLAPLSYHQLYRFDLLKFLHLETAESFHESSRASQILNHLYRKEIIRFLQRLGEGAIEAVILKGAVALFQPIYGHPADRTMGDVDLLVAERDRPVVTKILEGMDYRRAESDSHSKDLFTNPALNIDMEIHYRLFHDHLGKRDAESLDRKLWRRKVRLADCPYPAFALVPEDALFFHIYHASVWHREWIYDSLYTLVDFVALSRFYARETLLNDVLVEAAQKGLDQFFISFLYIVKEKTGCDVQTAFPASQRLKRSLDLYIERESLHPALHRFHVRRLILGGFEEGLDRRLLRLYHTVAADMQTFWKRYCRRDRRKG